MEQTAMMEQIASIPQLMYEITDITRRRAKQTASQVQIGRVKRIILTGCGDSLGAVMATKHFFLNCTRLPVQIETAIDLARHMSADQLADEEVLVIMVSNSGKVSRIIELAKRIKQLGGGAIAVTSNEQSPLFEHTSLHLKLDVPKFHRSGPGMRSYLASMLGLYELAIALGNKKGTLSNENARAMQDEMDKLPGLISIEMPKWQTNARKIAEKLKNCIFHEFVADGGDYATAWFGYAKELEVAGLPGCTSNTEDWLHMNYFVRPVHQTALHMIANGNSPAFGRSLELLKTASEMDRPLLCITDEPQAMEGFTKGNLYILGTPRLASYELNPSVQYLPLSLVMAYLGVLLGEEDFRGTKNHWTACIDFATVAQSEEIVIP